MLESNADVSLMLFQYKVIKDDFAYINNGVTTEGVKFLIIMQYHRRSIKEHINTMIPA